MLDLEDVKLSKDCVTGGEVSEITLPVNGAVRRLRVGPHASIKFHRNDDQWEVYMCDDIVCIRFKGEEFELVNESEEEKYVITIQGTEDYSKRDLSCFFFKCGYNPFHQSLIKLY